MDEYGTLTIYSTVPGMRYIYGAESSYPYVATLRRVRSYFNDSCTYETACELAATFRKLHRNADIHCEWQPHARAVNPA